jgi:hypothetical protein
MNEYYVYALTNPLKDDQYFYIGKGLGDRCMAHFKEKVVVNPHKTNTIKMIQGLGLEVGVVKIKEGLTETDAFDLEEKLIKQYGRKDYEEGGILTNICTDMRPPNIKDQPIEKQIAWRKAIGQGNSKAWALGNKTFTSEMQKRLLAMASLGGKAKFAKYGQWNTGLTKDDPRIQNWMAARAWYTHHSDETKAKMSATRKGRKHSEAHAKAIADAKRGLLQPKVTCPHCQKIGGVTGMKRWHFDKCKEKV